MGSPTKPNIVSFGAFEFNTYSGELRKEGMRVRLEGQPLAVLRMLLDRPGELVTRRGITEEALAGGHVCRFRAQSERRRQAVAGSAN